MFLAYNMAMAFKMCCKMCDKLCRIIKNIHVMTCQCCVVRLQYIYILKNKVPSSVIFLMPNNK